MNRKFRHRIQEKLADRFDWVQYPHISPTSEREQLEPPIRWKYRMPLSRRIALAAVSIYAFLIFGFLAIFGIFMFVSAFA